MMASSENRVATEDRDTSIDVATMETEFKKDKSRAKSNFTRSRNKLLMLIEETEFSNRAEVKEAYKKMDNFLERVLDVLSNFSDFYTRNKEHQKGKQIVSEMERIEEEFYTASEAAREYLDSHRDDSSSVSSEMLTINLQRTLNINDASSETQPKEHIATEHPRALAEVHFSDRSKSIDNSVPVTFEKQSRPATLSHKTDATDKIGSIQQIEGIHPGWLGNAEKSQHQDAHEEKPIEIHMNACATPFEPRVHHYRDLSEPAASYAAPSVGQDLWRQLKRVQIPVFSGDKRTYQSWKAAFLACIDSAPATGEYKLLQLRQYLAGEALKTIENLGHSATAYEAAKDRLERKFGGSRRQIAIYLEDLENFRLIRQGNAKDLEQFADLLDIAIINLQETDQYHELGNGSLYTKLQRKLPQSMLANYHRWIFENKMSESVATLRKWVLQESEFQTVASETVYGVTGRATDTQTTQPGHKLKSTRTFFGDKKDYRSMKKFHCQVCGAEHGIWKCQTFVEKSVAERWNLAKRFHLCFRCLAEGHSGKTCPRSRQCGQNGCKELHHRLLHRQPHDINPKLSVTDITDSTEVKLSDLSSSKQITSGMEGNERRLQTTMTACDVTTPDFIVLRTVPVILRNGNRSLKVNALLDDASTKTYVNADVAAELGLKGKTERVTVNVLNGQVETFETRPVDMEIESLAGDVRLRVTAYTANKVTGTMSVFDWSNYAQRWPHLRHINFPRNAKRPVIDCLIGLDCIDLHCAIQEVRGRPGEPIARLTPLGWTCIGNPGSNGKATLQTNFASTYFVRDRAGIEELNASLKRFWEIEDMTMVQTGTMGEKPIVRLEEQIALKKVEQSIQYEKNMYRVGVPWHSYEPTLPNNYRMALRRLDNTEKRLTKSPTIATAYSEIINQYIEKGYIRKVQEQEKNDSKWYLPHFPVIRPDKETTKTRIVFDASAKCDNVSLNDVIHQGPKLQRDLFDVLMRFRRFPVAVVCDIAEMYLQIGIAAEDKPYHRFLWRGIQQNRQPDVYEFDRVVFGVNSSPFQAQFVLQSHAKKYQREFPMAAETILKSTYMDDSMDSVLNEEQGIRLYSQLSGILTTAGMHARKWLSNSSKVLSGIPLQDRKSEVDLDRDQLPSTKTLGVWWLADEDIFTFREQAPESNMAYTKRNFLKKIASLFDPIGVLAPFTVRAKMLLQDMWSAGMEWDDELTEPLINLARAWFNELEILARIQIPRCLQDKERSSDTMSLHTFVDASESAYGAVVYARCTYADGSFSSKIVAAKTRVAPNTATSIPRLELMGAVIGVRLASRVAKVLEIPMSSSIFWSDSLNVLWWIRGRSREFKPFVANRIGEIQTSTDPEQWKYIPTDQNPADILSRGMTTTELLDCTAWWRGPEFLSQPEDTWPINKLLSKPSGDMEAKRSTRSKQRIPRCQVSDIEGSFYGFLTTVESSAFPVEPKRYSSWYKLKRVLAWINRFIQNSQRSKIERTFGELLADELKTAEIQLVRHAQLTEFRDEWASLSRGRTLPANSKLLGLQPRLDDDGLLRSDGRLKNAKFLSYDVRYPIILPRKCWTTKLIVKDFHEKGNHASGTNQTLAALSARYWIISGREAVREWEKECAECRRRKAKACQQIMAPLPLSRLKTSLRAFTRTAVDFAGPFITIQGRGKRRMKRYLCLFTCLATRAVHLEMAFGLDTDSFLNAFYRMTSRRGLPEEMYSDNGTNLKAADKELKSLLSQLDPERIKESVANKGIVWHFNPPLAPHFGGVHESMVKSAKRAINAILGNADITDEELMTTIIGAEGLINSRPLTYQSANPTDDVPLTPNHFLHGQIGGQFAPTTVDDTQYHPRKRWRRVQELVRHFWHRWLQEWLPSLGARKKWHQERRDVRVGEVVLVISPDTSRGNWPLGRVVEVYPGNDGRVRVAKLQVGQGTLVRSVTKLCPLEFD